MTAILKVDEIQDTSGNLIIKEDSNTITVGASGDTITIPSGATLDGSNATLSGFATTNGITEADQWRLTTNTNQGSNTDVTSNWERNDSTGATYIGTGLSESSGIFTFPSTGIYLIIFQMALDTDNGDTNAEVLFKVTTNNSSYSTVAFGLTGNGSSSDIRSTITNSYILDVTDTSNVKFRFGTSGFSTNTRIVGDTSTQISGFTSIRLGDT